MADGGQRTQERWWHHLCLPMVALVVTNDVVVGSGGTHWELVTLADVGSGMGEWHGIVVVRQWWHWMQVMMLSLVAKAHGVCIIIIC